MLQLNTFISSYFFKTCKMFFSVTFIPALIPALRCHTGLPLKASEFTQNIKQVNILLK